MFNGQDMRFCVCCIYYAAVEVAVGDMMEGGCGRWMVGLMMMMIRLI